MNFMNPVVALCFASVTLSSVGVLAQANVSEVQSAVLTVDANLGSDVSAGAGQPLKTLQAAVDKAIANNSQGFGTRILINPGDYREVLSFSSSNAQTEAPITLEAAQTGSVTISGSDLLTNWYQTSGNRSIYTHAWNYNLGTCSVPRGWPSGIKSIVLRKEMLFVNNASLTQVLSLSQMRSGTFYVDQGAHVIHAWPAGGNMNSAKVEAAVRPQTLNVSGRHNIVFRGLVFQHAANCINTDGANVNSSTNVLFDSVLVQWNNWGGLGINFSNGITVKNSIAIHNGGVGFAGYHSRNALYENDEASYNNWRGASGGLLDWGMGGLKLVGMHTGTVTQYRAVQNEAQGLWFDTDNRNININNVHLIGNKVANLQLEANPGPISMSNSSLCYGDRGMNVIDTENLTATGNVFYGNSGGQGGGAQFFLAGNPGGRQQVDWESHQHYLLHTSNMNLRNNVFQDAGSGQNVFKTYLNGGDWGHFASNVSASGNRYYDSSSANKIFLPGNHATNFKGWQSAIRSDYSSSWSSDSGAAGACH